METSESGYGESTEAEALEEGALEEGAGKLSEQVFLEGTGEEHQDNSQD